MDGKAFAEECSNPHRDDYWTCPGCYADLGDVGEGIHACSECERLLETTIVYEPCCHARLIKTERNIK